MVFQLMGMLTVNVCLTIVILLKCVDNLQVNNSLPAGHRQLGKVYRTSLSLTTAETSKINPHCSIFQWDSPDNNCMLACEPASNTQQASRINDEHSPCYHQKITSLKITRLLTSSTSVNSFVNDISPQTFVDDNYQAMPNLTDVQFLDLSANFIEIIRSEDFDKFENVVHLNLSHNKLKMMENKCLIRLTKLISLDLSNNLLNCISEDLFIHLNNLVTLNLSGNEFVNFSFTHLMFSENLRDLDLSYNQLTRLDPGNLQQQVKIEKINLNSNRFNILPIISLALKHLKYLSLDNNPIEEIGRHSLVSLPNLAEVHMRSLNILKSIEGEAFKNLTSLQIIDMSFNPKLAYVDFNSFVDCPNVVEINLEYGCIQTLSSQFLHNFKHLQMINLTGNPIEYDCNNKWMLNCQPCNTSPEINFILKQNRNEGDCPPFIYPLFDKFYHLAVGEPMKLKCRGVGLELTNVFWSFIGLGSRYHMFHDHDELDDLHFKQNKSTITVDHVAPYHAGLYSCNVHGDTGKQTLNATVRIYNRNASVYFTSYSRTSITVEWSGTETTMKTTEYFISCRRLIEPHIQFEPIHHHNRRSSNSTTDVMLSNYTSIHPSLSHHPIYQHKMPFFANGEAASLSFIKVKIGPFMRRNTFNGLSPMTPYEICLSVSNHTERRNLNNHDKAISNSQYLKSLNDNSYYLYEGDDNFISLSCFNFTTLDRSTGGFEYEPGIRRLPILQILLGTFGCLAVLIVLYAICNSLVSAYCNRYVSNRSNKHNVNNVYKLVTCRSERRNSLTLVPIETTFIENSRSSSRTSLIS